MSSCSWWRGNIAHVVNNIQSIWFPLSMERHPSFCQVSSPSKHSFPLIGRLNLPAYSATRRAKTGALLIHPVHRVAWLHRNWNNMIGVEKSLFFSKRRFITKLFEKDDINFILNASRQAFYLIAMFERFYAQGNINHSSWLILKIRCINCIYIMKCEKFHWNLKSTV